ncbi:hypothetical protein Ciccas_002315 [Cichlidogyrus casuarinus]|uniref:PDZ domain-containing protein n=1 Tax=Cichlidogyrus casuarinus TaxID=1844966 RepID=A0ABD2QHJ5_9PLAT
MTVVVISSCSMNPKYQSTTASCSGITLRPRLGASAVLLKRPLEPVLSGEPLEPSLLPKRRPSEKLSSFWSVKRNSSQTSDTNQLFNPAEFRHDPVTCVTRPQKHESRSSICTNPNIRKRYYTDDHSDSDKENVAPGVSRSSSTMSVASTPPSSAKLTRVGSKSMMALQLMKKSARQTVQNVCRAVRKSIDQPHSKAKSNNHQTIILRRKSLAEPFGLFVCRCENGFKVTRVSSTMTKLSVGDELVEINRVQAAQFDLKSLQQQMKNSLELRLVVSRTNL